MPPFLWQRVSRDGNCMSSMLHAGKTASETLCLQHYRFISPNILGLPANTTAVVLLHSLLPLQWQDSANLCFTSNSSPAEADLLQVSYSSLQAALGQSRSWFLVSDFLLWVVNRCLTGPPPCPSSPIEISTLKNPYSFSKTKQNKTKNQQGK